MSKHEYTYFFFSDSAIKAATHVDSYYDMIRADDHGLFTSYLRVPARSQVVACGLQYPLVVGDIICYDLVRIGISICCDHVCHPILLCSVSFDVEHSQTLPERRTKLAFFYLNILDYSIEGKHFLGLDHVLDYSIEIKHFLGLEYMLDCTVRIFFLGDFWLYDTLHPGKK